MSRWTVLLHIEYMKYKLFFRSQRGASSHFWGKERWFNLCEHLGDIIHRDSWNTWSLSALGKEFCLCSFCLCMKGSWFLSLHPLSCSCASAGSWDVWLQLWHQCDRQGFHANKGLITVLHSLYKRSFFLSFCLSFFFLNRTQSMKAHLSRKDSSKSLIKYMTAGELEHSVLVLPSYNTS